MPSEITGYENGTRELWGGEAMIVFEEGPPREMVHVYFQSAKAEGR
jgi:hypothetical protein